MRLQGAGSCVLFFISVCAPSPLRAPSRQSLRLGSHPSLCQLLTGSPTPPWRTLCPTMTALPLFPAFHVCGHFSPGRFGLPSGGPPNTPHLSEEQTRCYQCPCVILTLISGTPVPERFRDTWQCGLVRHGGSGPREQQLRCDRCSHGGFCCCA